MGGPVATHMKCCPAHLNSCPTSTRIMKNPIPWYKKMVREFERGTRGWFLRKAVPRQGGGGYSDVCLNFLMVFCCGEHKLVRDHSSQPWTPKGEEGAFSHSAWGTAPIIANYYVFLSREHP